MNRIWGVIVCSLCILGLVARAADDPQTGNWKLNVAKSKFVTATPPKSQTVTVAPYGKDGVSLTVDVLNAQGEKLNIQYSASYDGKPYPRTETGAGAVSGQTVTLKHIDAQTAERIAYLAGKKLVTERWIISKDGKTRTVTQTGVDAQGKPVNNVLVYEKQ
jgi:hypothetical protein